MRITYKYQCALRDNPDPKNRWREHYIKFVDNKPVAFYMPDAPDEGWLPWVGILSELAVDISEEDVMLELI